MGRQLHAPRRRVEDGRRVVEADRLPALGRVVEDMRHQGGRQRRADLAPWTIEPYIRRRLVYFVWIITNAL